MAGAAQAAAKVRGQGARGTRGDEVEVRLHQVSLSGYREERARAECHGGTHRSVHGEEISALVAGVMHPKHGSPGLFSYPEPQIEQTLANSSVSVDIHDE